MNIQFKKGVLEMCVLVMLESGDRYGYDIRQRAFSKHCHLQRHRISDPAPTEAGGIRILLFSGISRGRPRKYYAITPQGKRLADSLKTEWLSFSERVTA